MVSMTKPPEAQPTVPIYSRIPVKLRRALSKEVEANPDLSMNDIVVEALTKRLARHL